MAGGDSATVDAVREVIEAGGNAVDGAVAGVFMSMVAESTLTSAGGGGVMMVCPADGEPVVFDFFTDMPTGCAVREDLDFFRVTVDFGPATQDFHIGRGAAGVPSNVAGLLHAQERLGRLKPKTVLAPAIRAASKGIPISSQQAMFVQMLAPILTHEPSGQALYAPDGKLLEEGDRIVMPEFAAFLEELAVEGSRMFYHGETARLIADWAESGGLIQRSDLENYRVQERKPLVCNFCDHTVLLNPPPASSGVLVDFTLTLMEKAGCTRTGHVSLRDLVCALEMTGQIRDVRMSNAAGPKHHFSLSEDDWKGCLKAFYERRPSPSPKTEPRTTGSTTHLSVLDREGNGVSVTTTNGEGCGSMLPQAGFMLNNMLGEEDINPDGFHQYKPGSRISTMMAPTMVLQKNRPVLVTGSGGSNRIRSVLVQVLVNVLCRGMNLEQAIQSPRIHYDGEILHAESGFPKEELDGLPNDLPMNEWDGLSLFFGGAHSVGPFGGVGDPRRSGCAIMFD